MVFLPGARSIPSRVWLHGLPATKPWASFDLCAEHIHENHFPKVSWAGNARTPALLPVPEAASTRTHVDTQPSTLGHQPSGSEPPEGASETPHSPSGEG